MYCGRRHSCADEIGLKLNSRGRRRGLYSGAKGLVRIRTAAKSVHNSMPTKVDRVGMIHLLRIFDKLGISTRVELVLYAVSHGENRQAEWMPGSA